MRITVVLFFTLVLALALFFRHQSRVSPPEANRPQASTQSTSAPGIEPAPAPGSKPVSKLPPKPLPPPCRSFEYRLAREGHLPELEDYLDAQSLLPLPFGPISESSICVKVDDRVVAHRLIREGAKASLLLGPVVGPESKIRVSFCAPGARCAKKCGKTGASLANQSFLDGLMDDTPTGEPADPDLRTLRAKAKELKAIARNDVDLTESETIRAWTLKPQQEWSCKE